MYNFLEIGEGKTGFVNLKEILKADSLPALLNSLSEQASSSVMKGRFKAELSNLEKIIDTCGHWRLCFTPVPSLASRNGICLALIWRRCFINWTS
jgi:hypothetical protein